MYMTGFMLLSVIIVKSLAICLNLANTSPLIQSAGSVVRIIPLRTVVSKTILVLIAVVIAYPLPIKNIKLMLGIMQHLQLLNVLTSKAVLPISNKTQFLGCQKTNFNKRFFKDYELQCTFFEQESSWNILIPY